MANVSHIFTLKSFFVPQHESRNIISFRRANFSAMEFHFFCFSVIIIQPLHNISLCFSAVAKAAAARQIRKRYFAHFLATVVACECATYTHIEQRSVMKSVRNKIEFRALNKNALVVVSYFIFLPPPVPVLFCTSFEIL